ncbi:cytochrome oxidase assembly protein [Propioniciclava coleopterorum]|uniref:Cytochrome oxidase assembly protein n=1 Tax=Propioniciclava coleopterorum TaxID=2714937 RepID=A0A6G7Y8G9_9ACTN|nr:cytochrome oxidase assembly protein [Propioniciclava coleopterorum]QIK73009.1 cytochrome oxidase assembly protein [Propioniciclava coleopterorum]
MPTTTHRRVSRWAAILIFVTVTLGGVVCATDSSSACPAWPVCYADQVGPALQAGWLENPIIEFVHRAISFAGLVLLGVSGRLGRRSADARVRVLPWVALGCAVGSAVFGMMIILFTLPFALGLLDLGFALVAMVLAIVTDRALRAERRASSEPFLARLAAGTLVLLGAMHLLGSVVAGTTAGGVQSYTRCLSWPLWQIHDIDRLPALQVLRIGMALSAIVLIAAVTALAARRPAVRVPAFVAAGCLAVELALGALITTAGLAPTQTNGIDATIAVLYSVAAVAIMGALAWVLGAALPAADDGADDHALARLVAQAG